MDTQAVDGFDHWLCAAQKEGQGFSRDYISAKQAKAVFFFKTNGVSKLATGS
jgi:hypothetical protein